VSALDWYDTSRCPVGARCVGCGVSDAELYPACTGSPDLCGAPAGTPCAPGCPSRAADDYPPGLLAVTVYGGPAASLCLTTCWACAATPPKLTADAALRLVVEHRGHVGATR
jgi:hypothetical protein